LGYLEVVWESTPASDAVAQTCVVLHPASGGWGIGLSWVYAELWTSQIEKNYYVKFTDPSPDTCSCSGIKTVNFRRGGHVKGMYSAGA
jgi:hypothetical protein